MGAAGALLDRLQELTGAGNSLPLYLGTAAVALLVLLLLTRRGAEEAEGNGSGGRIRRAMSFTSAACAEGPMPPHAQMHPEDPIINAVVLLEGAPTREEVVAAIQPLFYFERFRSRKVKARDRWFWEVLDAHEIQPAKHVVEEVFAGQGMDALFRQLELLAQQPLRQPADAPAFEFAVMRSKAGKGPAAVVARVNHAIGDGISLARLIPVVFKDLKGEPLPPSDKFRRREAGFKPSLTNPLSILSSLIKVIGTPMTAFDTDIGLTIPEKQKIVFTRRRRIVRVPTLKLSFIKSVKTAANTTVNDVIYAATAGAFHRLRAAHQDSAILDPNSGDKVKVRALLPVALPRQEGDPVRGMRNKWSFASVPMPVGAKTPLERLRASHGAMDGLKNSPIVIVQNNFEALVGTRLPWPVTQQVAYDSFVRHTFVFSNVPGPDLPVTLAGKAVTGLYMVYANLIPQVGALSLNGKIYTCMLLDPEVTPGLDTLGDHFIEELMELAKATGQAGVTRADIVAEE